MFKKLMLAGLLLSAVSLLGKTLAFFRDVLFARELGFNNQLDNYLMLFTLAMFLVSIVTGALNSVFASYIRRHSLSFHSFYKQFSALVCLLVLVFSICCLYVLPSAFSILSNASIFVVFCFVGVTAAGLYQAPLVALLTAKKQQVFLSVSQLVLPAMGVVTVLSLIIVQLPITVVDLTLALLFAYVIHFVLLFARSRRFLSDLTVSERDSGESLKVSNKPLFKEFGWIVVSSSLLATLPIVDLAFASQLGDGSVSILSNGYKFVTVAQSVLAMSLGSLLIPYMAEWADDLTLLRQRLIKALGAAGGVGVAVGLFLYVIMPFAVSIMFNGSEVTNSQSAELSEVGQAYTLLVPFYLVGMVLSRCVVSLGKAKLMLTINGVAFILNIVMDYLMSSWFGLIGIAFTTSIIYLISVLMLFWVLRSVFVNSSGLTLRKQHD
ncbi:MULTISPECIES: lipid II flippase MurJ [unclassified Agarivorans]|uniref:lipid II flippase MurJ n=1 Tax=unclassified Agarivorans TaxID=2636026 RepID=UPI0026E11F41|nr:MULTISPECIES: lipid II flippase MurJ [unclassified Agarivorans]MDO6686280.1 lipid II flippase MurJ [Agarivorans sp. 3_MG-2023]MDO6716271.1 lipid II flippase MurJ [Agarivorans sp. 2_MG-2023]